MNISDDRIDAVAKKIGVQPDVLLEARVRHRVGVTKFGYARANERAIINLDMPEPVHVVWKQEVQDRGVDATALLRSVVNAYLTSSYEPVEVTSRWIWQGKVWPTSSRRWEMANKGKYWPWRIQLHLPSGARRALAFRAKARASTATAILRALVLEIVTGGWESVRLIDVASMPDDERHYNLGAAEDVLLSANVGRTKALPP